MKKVFQSRQQKRIQQIRSQRTLKIRRKPKRPRHRNYKPYVAKKRRKTLTAPEHMSFTNNTEETLKYFDRACHYFKIFRGVHLDFSKIKKISPGVILYLLSLMEMYGKKCYISGNAPNDDHCRHLFVDSGLYNYVRSGYKPKEKPKDMFQIRSGNSVEGKIAREVIGFSFKSLGLTRTHLLNSKRIYTTIIECMGNTREHAYKGTEEFEAKWWLMAHYNKKTKEVVFTILDNGVGIPSTIRKGWAEKVALIKQEYRLILSALHGEFRTRTKLRYRGKGLPTIFEIFTNGHIEDLVILSGKAHLDYSQNNMEDLGHRFHGTLVSWKFSKKRR